LLLIIPMYAIQRQTLAPEQPIRYEMLDRNGKLLYTAERTTALLDLDQQRMQFLDRDGEPVAQLIPPQGHSLWRATNTYTIILTGEDRPRYTLEQTYSLVDRILLRAPRYKLHALDVHYATRGSRHGEHFYELFDDEDANLGQITRPASGPTYLIESEAPALLQLPLLLAALTIVLDLELAASEV
jgi:hypothetical protein